MTEITTLDRQPRNVLEGSTQKTERERLEVALTTARREHARSLETRMTRGVRGETEDQIARADEIRLAYEEVRNAYGSEILGDDIVNAVSPEEKNALVIGYLMSENQALNDEMENPTALTVMQRAKRLGRRAMTSVGEWMSTGSKKAQFVKSAVVTGAASTLLGVVGGGVAAAGGMAAVRYMKGYAGGLAKSVDHQDTLKNDMTSGLNAGGFTTIHQSFDRASEIMRSDDESMVSKHQERNRKARNRGLGVMTIGAVVGTTMGSILHDGLSLPAHAESNSGKMTFVGGGRGITPFPTGESSSSNLPLIPWDKNLNLTGSSSANLSLGTASDAVRDNLSLADASHTPNLSLGSTDAVKDNLSLGTDVAHVDSNLPLGDKGAPSHEFNLSKAFEVEAGHGDTHELMDLAKAHDVNLTSEQAWELHKAVIDELAKQGHGLDHGNYITLGDHAGSDAYSMGDTPYEVGIAAPSVEAHITPEAQELINKAFSQIKENGSFDGFDGDVSTTAADTAASVDAASVADNLSLAGDTAASTVEFDASQPFEVTPGEGLTQNLVQAAQVNDVLMTPDMATYNHEALVNLVGKDYVNLGDHDGADVYSMGEGKYDIGIAAPSSEATWSTDAQPYIADAADDGLINGSTGLDVSSLDAYKFTDGDWSQFEDMLKSAAADDRLAEVSQHGEDLMNNLGPVLDKIEYPDGSDVVTMDNSGNWSFVDSEQPLPEKALEAIHEFLDKSDDAVKQMQQIAKVL